jgi:hypothetical protein
MEHQDQYNKWSIIYSYHNKPIHLEHLQQSNPNAQIILLDFSKNELGWDRQYIWRNSDKRIRIWAQKNADIIQYNNIAILEWDVLVTKSLPDFPVSGLYGGDIQIPGTRHWDWFNEISRLPEEYQKYAIGISPLSVIFMNKYCIDNWIDTKYDSIYELDIFGELRLPTVINHAGLSIKKYTMPNVNDMKVLVQNIPDIYHPVKKYISSNNL